MSRTVFLRTETRIPVGWKWVNRAEELRLAADELHGRVGIDSPPEGGGELKDLRVPHRNPQHPNSNNQRLGRSHVTSPTTPDGIITDHPSTQSHRFPLNQAPTTLISGLSQAFLQVVDDVLGFL